MNEEAKKIPGTKKILERETRRLVDQMKEKLKMS